MALRISDGEAKKVKAEHVDMKKVSGVEMLLGHGVLWPLPSRSSAAPPKRRGNFIAYRITIKLRKNAPSPYGRGLG